MLSNVMGLSEKNILWSMQFYVLDKMIIVWNASTYFFFYAKVLWKNNAVVYPSLGKLTLWVFSTLTGCHRGRQLVCGSNVSSLCECFHYIFQSYWLNLIIIWICHLQHRWCYSCVFQQVEICRNCCSSGSQASAHFAVGGYHCLIFHFMRLHGEYINVKF